MQPCVSLRQTKDVDGLTRLRLENERLAVTLIPELGSKIWQIEYKTKKVPLLWQHPLLRLAPVPQDADYERNFFGGWDDIFPNDMPEPILGEMRPDHGELWSSVWNYEAVAGSPDEWTVRLWTHSEVCSGLIEKWVTLRKGEPTLRVRCRITNYRQEPIPYLWKQHIAMRTDEFCRIDLGAKSMYIDVYGESRAGRVPQSYDWPYLTDRHGRRHDMRRTFPGSAGLKEFQYATQMSSGWCALTNRRIGVGFGLSFDLQVMPSCWVVASYGAWDGIETVILEPCSGFPMYVADGVKQGTHRVLEPGERIDTTIVGVVFESRTGVADIDSSGRVVLDPGEDADLREWE